MLGIARPAVQAREVQDATAGALDELILSDGARVGGVVGRVGVVPVGRGEDAGTAELNEAAVWAVDVAVERGKELGLVGALEGKGDEDGAGGGESLVGFEVGGAGREDEGDGGFAASGRGGGVGYGEAGQEGCEEG